MIGLYRLAFRCGLAAFGALAALGAAGPLRVRGGLPPPALSDPLAALAAA